MEDDADSNSELRFFCVEGEKKTGGNRRAIRTVECTIQKMTTSVSTELFCLNLAQNSSIKQESALIGLGPFWHKKECWQNKLNFTSPKYLLKVVCIGFVKLSSRVF